jgi:hypothetical protein
MSGRETVAQLYQTTLRPVLDGLEADRKAALNKVTLTWVIAGLVAAGGGLGMLVGLFPLFLLVMLALVVGGIIASRIRAGFAAVFKERVIGPVVQAFDPSFRYSPATGIGQGEFQTTGLFRHRIDRYRCEDLVEGQLGQTAVRFSEVHAEYKTETRDSKGRKRTQWHTIFKGLFFVADFNKHFAGSTYVLPDTAQRLFGSFGQTLQSWGSSHGELVKLEDPEFEKAFAVFGSDQIETRYILSPSLMRRILDFRTRTNYGVHLAFVQSSVVVAISIARDLFEPSLTRSLHDPALLQTYWDDLALAAGLVEELNLNTRIWTKA